MQHKLSQQQWIVKGAVLLPLWVCSGAQLQSPQPPPAVLPVSESCAIVEDYLGDVEILSSNQAQFNPVHMHDFIGCGHSITVGKGWIRIRLNRGVQLHLGEHTLVQFPSRVTGSPFQEDQLVVFQGAVYADGRDPQEELRIVSATARVRLRQGQWVFSFDPAAQTTQLVSLAGKASLENRFDPTTITSIAPGEFTELNFELLRMTPSLPAVLSVASLRPQLAALQVPSEVVWNTIQSVLKKQEKQSLSVALKEPFPPQRKPAHAKLDAKRAGGRTSFPPDLKQKWLRSLTSGAEDAEVFLFPQERYGSSQKAGLQILDVPVLGSKPETKKDLEKERIIHALQAIHIP